MGDNHGEYGDEKPEHEVELDSFWLGQYPVTQQIWEVVMGENPSYFKGENRPVEGVSWYDTQAFFEEIKRPTQITRSARISTTYGSGMGICCQGRKSNRICWKHGLGEMVGWYRENSSGQTHEVGLKAPNEWGLYDMSGNVWEWCQDGYSETYYQECFDKGKVKNPTGPKPGGYRVLRGGSWYYTPQVLPGLGS